VLLAEADAPLLGTGLGHAPVVERITHLPPGALLVAYSDGLVDRRGADVDDQLALFVDVVTRACDPANARTAQSIAADILNALVPEPGPSEGRRLRACGPPPALDGDRATVPGPVGSVPFSIIRPSEGQKRDPVT